MTFYNTWWWSIVATQIIKDNLKTYLLLGVWKFNYYLPNTCKQNQNQKYFIIIITVSNQNYTPQNQHQTQTLSTNIKWLQHSNILKAHSGLQEQLYALLDGSIHLTLHTYIHPSIKTDVSQPTIATIQKQQLVQNYKN